MALKTLGVPNADVSRVLAATSTRPRVAIVLGSGLSGLADSASDAVSIPYTELEGVPDLGAVAGHAAMLVIGNLAGIPVALFKGRVHQYQGADAWVAAWPSRMAAALGCDTIILTNAAGGVSERLRSGDVVLISDQINLMGTNPLTGWPGREGGTPFVPMRDAYDPELRALALNAAAAEGMVLHDGVYAGLLGPSYETPAEVAYLRAVGADIVGMSTVPETIAARALGMRVLGFSLVTNAAAGEDFSHADVLETGELAAADLTRLMLAILRGL